MADVEVKFGATLDDLLAASKQAGESIDSFKEHVQGAIEGIQHIAELASTAFVGHEIYDFIEGMAQLGTQTERTAEIFGTTTQEVGLLSFAAKVTGGSAEGLIRSLEKMSTNLVDLSGKATPTGVAIEAMGLKIKDLQGLGLTDVLEKLRDRFNELPPGLERTAIAQNLARNGAEELLPILSMSATQWDDLRQRFEDTGASMSEARAKTFDALSTSLDTMQTAITGLGEKIMDSLAPAITQAVDWMTKFIESIDAGKIRAALTTVSGIVIAVMSDITAFALDAYRVVAGVVIQMGDLGKKAQDIATIVSDFAGILSGNAVGAIAHGATPFTDLFNGNVDPTAQLASMNAGVDAQLKASTAMFASWQATIVSSVNQVADASSRGAKANDTDGWYTPPPKLGGVGATDALDAERAKINGEVAIDQAGLTQKKALLDEQLKDGQINQAQYTQAVIAATNEEFQAEVALLQKELALGNLKLTQRQEILNKIKELEAKNANDIQAIEVKAADAVRAQWKGVVDAIGSSITSQLGSMLRGTETFAQAAGNVLLDLAQKGIDAIVQMA